MRRGDVDGVVLGPGAFEHDLIVRQGYDNVPSISDRTQPRPHRDPFRVLGVDDCDLGRGDRHQRRGSERSGDGPSLRVARGEIFAELFGPGGRDPVGRLVGIEQRVAGGDLA